MHELVWIVWPNPEIFVTSISFIVFSYKRGRKLDNFFLTIEIETFKRDAFLNSRGKDQF